MAIKFPTTAPAKESTATLNVVVKQMSYAELEGVLAFVKEHFLIYSTETVWDDEAQRTMRVRVRNQLAPEVERLYRLVTGALVWYEEMNLVQLTLPF